MTDVNAEPGALIHSGTVLDLIETAFDRYSARTAVIDGPSGRSVTYGELGKRVDTLAAWLSEQGISRGSVVATWAPNVPPVIAFTLAAMRRGAAVTGINPVATDDEVARQFSDAGVAAIIAPPALADRARGFRVSALVLGDTASGTPLNAVLANPRTVPDSTLTGDDLALLPYSSGTTGAPKGVMLSHGNIAAVIQQILERIEVNAGDVTVAVAPFFHILGSTAAMLVPLAAGATIVTLPAFDPAQFLALIQRHRATYLAVPPPIASFLAVHPMVAGYDLASLDFLACGGAPLAPAVQERLSRRLPHCVAGQGWGLTETSGAASIPQRRMGSAPGTVGKPLRDTDVRVVDPDTGMRLDSGSLGELEVRGPQNMRGYLNREAETGSILRPDGWLRTGDLGHIDAENNVVIVDRIKDLIKVKGLQVSPTEVESALVQHPAVADAGVTSRPDDRAGEVPVAFVVRNSDVTTEELLAWLGERLSPYKQPAEIRFTGALPRTPSGKLVRRFLDLD